MWIKELKLYNIQSYESATLHFSKNINVLIGPNNSGKSTIIKSLYKLQVPYVILPQNIRKEEHYGEIRVAFSDAREWYFASPNKEGDWELPKASEQTVILRIREPNLTSCHYDSKYDRYIGFPCLETFHPRDQKGTSLDYYEFRPFSQEEPDNFIYPFLSKRRRSSFDERPDRKNSHSVSDDLRNLTARIQHLINPTHPEHYNYENSCKDILGFGVGLIPGLNGSGIGVYSSRTEAIPIESMGEGVANIVGLLCLLYTDEDKLFLIEELENDIHPTALKKLLNLIISKSDRNQFVISTHSNIVAKYLGAVPGSKLFQTSYDAIQNIPTSTVTEVPKTPEAKQKVLEDLGYELYDYNLWEGYLILEESSAEAIIREFLIPWFAPGLNGRLRTISANGVGKVVPAFEDFRRLFLFTHLEPSYKNKAWVIVDGESAGLDIIKRLKEIFGKGGWKESCFQALSKHDFEEYYPSKFQKEIKVAIDLRGSVNKQKKRDIKQILVEKVKKWARENGNDAKKEFAKSAKEVITLLQSIEKQLKRK